MTEKRKDPARVLLKNVRLSYPALWKAKAFGGKGDQGEPKFQANFLMDKDDKIGQRNIEKLEDAIEHVKKEKWPKGAPKLAAAKICLRDSEDMEEMADGYENCMYVSSSNAKRPKVLDADGLEVREGNEGAPYAGCYVDAIVRVWAQDNEYGKRINCSLEGVKFRDDGEAFGAAPVDASDFDDDEDDDRPAKKSTASKRRPADEDEEEERPARKRRPADEDEEEERPARKRRPADEDDEPPARKRRPADEDEEEERPARKRRPADEDEEEERPARKRRPVEDEDEEEVPRRRRTRSED